MESRALARAPLERCAARIGHALKHPSRERTGTRGARPASLQRCNFKAEQYLHEYHDRGRQSTIASALLFTHITSGARVAGTWNLAKTIRKQAFLAMTSYPHGNRKRGPRTRAAPFVG
jgi:hypothetical protein